MMFIVSKIIRSAREQPTGEELNYDDKSMRIIHIKWTASGNYRDDESVYFLVLARRPYFNFNFKLTRKCLKIAFLPLHSYSRSIITILCDSNTFFASRAMKRE